MYIGQGHLNPISRVFQDIFSWHSLFLFACTIILCIIWQLMVFAKGRKAGEKRKSARHFTAIAVFLLYLMLVYRQTGMSGLAWWVRSPLIALNRIALVPFSTSNDLVPYLYNILMFIPFGFLLPAIWPTFRSLKKVTIVAFLFSLTIETMQLFTNRLSATDDLIMNTLGAIIGYLICKALFCIFPGVQHKEKPNTHPLFHPEAFIYIALSLIGIMFLYHPAVIALLAPR